MKGGAQLFPISSEDRKKKEEIDDVQLEQLVRYKGELPGWECGQVPGRLSGGSAGNLLTWRCRGLAAAAAVVGLKAGVWTGWDPEHSHASMGHFLAMEVGSLLPLSFGFPQGSILVRRAPWRGSARR